MIVPGYFLPSSVEPGQLLHLGFGGVTVEVPRPEPALLINVLDSISLARDHDLGKRPILDILEALDDVIARWLDPDYSFRRLAEATLPATTGFSPQMVAHGLTAMLEGYRKRLLWRVLEAELQDPLVLDGFRPRASGQSRAYGPRLITHILSGNIPALGAPSLIYALLAKSASLMKGASEEPVFPALFARSLAEVDPRLGECVAVVWWRGGDEALEEVAFSRSDLVIAYGSEETMKSVKARVPGRFVGHGHKLSFGVIGREALSSVEELAEQAAYDVSLFDQQGCLSPHLFYVEEGGLVSPGAFARVLAAAMEALHRQLPKGRTFPDEAAAITALRGSYEFRAIAGEDVALYQGEGTAWTVLYEQDPTFIPSCLGRTIRVKPVKDALDMLPLVTPFRRYLSAVGIALPSERLPRLADELGQLGVTRICPIGRMQHPGAGWHHDGRFQILDLLRWVTLESEG